VLIMPTELELPEVAGLDQTSITRPTQHPLVPVELHGEPTLVQGARVQGYELGGRPTAEALAGQRPILGEDLELVRQDDGTPCFGAHRGVPRQNTQHLLGWTVGIWAGPGRA
jgi:hypothetical protein